MNPTILPDLDRLRYEAQKLAAQMATYPECGPSAACVIEAADRLAMAWVKFPNPNADAVPAYPKGRWS